MGTSVIDRAIDNRATICTSCQRTCAEIQRMQAHATQLRTELGAVETRIDTLFNVISAHSHTPRYKEIIGADARITRDGAEAIVNALRLADSSRKYEIIYAATPTAPHTVREILN